MAWELRHWINFAFVLKTVTFSFSQKITLNQNKNKYYQGNYSKTVGYFINQNASLPKCLC